MVIGAFQRELTALLAQGGVEPAGFEAGCLLQKVLGCSREQLLLKRGEELPPEQEEFAQSLARKRAGGYPLQYLLGSWEFYGLEFTVGEGVLIPRADTECLVELAIRQIGEQPAAVADLCAGSGCIAAAVSRACPHAQMFAVELSQQALPYLYCNLENNRAGVTVVEGSVLDQTVAAQLPLLDAALSNPPYLTKQDMANLQKEVTFEPALALYGEQDGLHFYRGITALWKHKLKPGGLLAFEVGIDQHSAVKDILLEHEFTDCAFAQDLQGVNRVVYGYKRRKPHGDQERNR